MYVCQEASKPLDVTSRSVWHPETCAKLCLHPQLAIMSAWADWRSHFAIALEFSDATRCFTQPRCIRLMWMFSSVSNAVIRLSCHPQCMGSPSSDSVLQVEARGYVDQAQDQDTG